MPEHLKALVVIVALAATVFAAARPAVCAVAMAEDDFVRRRNVWFGATLIAFLSHNFWIYVCATAALLHWQAQKEKNPLAFFFFILFAVPMFPADIPGLGLVRYFFSIHYVRVLELVVLLPCFLRLRKDPASAKFGSLLTDKFLFAYLALNFLLQLITDTFTNTLRLGLFYAFLDVFLPYYVASRSLRRIDQFRDALAAYVIAAMAMAAVGAFEAVRHWLLYGNLSGVLGQPWDYGRYLPRGETLRALGAVGQPIALGYVMAIACGLFLFLRPSVLRPRSWWLGMALLVAGLIAPVSRGPWTGAAVLLLVFLITGSKPWANLGRLVLALLLCAPVVYFSSLGDKIAGYLPFIGQVDAENVTYRQQLIDVAIQIILENPFFGAYDFIFSPAMQELKQGDQGIIDVVNTYVAVGLSSGLVGLSLFVVFFMVPIVGALKAAKQSSENDDEFSLLGRSVIAAMVSTMVVIFTVSSITVIPTIYWSLAGIAVAYTGMCTRVFRQSPGFELKGRPSSEVGSVESRRKAAGYAPS